jgi:dipeptidyl aminopeptidase/acylaminoacyl peptidase
MTGRSFPIACLILAALVSVAAPKLASAGKAARDLFLDEGIGNVRVSPTGEWIAASGRKGALSGILAQRVGSFQVTPVFALESRLDWLYWAGPDTTIAQFDTKKGRYLLRVDFSKTDNGGLDYRSTWTKVGGWLVSSLPMMEGVVLWAFEYEGHSSLHRVALDDLVEKGGVYPVVGKTVRLGERLAVIDGSVDRWIADKHGNPVAARRVDENGVTLLYRSAEDDEFREIAVPKEEKIKPLSLSPDGDALLVFAYNGHDKIGLYEFDPATATIGKEIYRRDDADLTDLSLDYLTRDLQSVSYEIDGQTHVHYLDISRRAYIDRIGHLPDDVPVESIWIESSSADRQQFVYWVSNTTEPGRHYFRNLPRDETTLVGERGPHVDRQALSPTESFHVESGDGTRIEAYLTRPIDPVAERAPLIVMPHGGPFDVRDLKEYDPLVQYLAGWGFAVLQPNYRGSAGYGRKFLQAGKKEWAQGIEDDIDAAVEHVIALPGIDPDRLCILGGSYGGFSATASIVRHRDRYRCAVSINGVSDVPLLYESSDFADLKGVIEFYDEFVGDLETERDKLIGISPAYHVAQIESPILLVYGDRDRRVDPDHSNRLALMLDLYGKEYEEVIVKGGHHSFDRDQWIDVAPKLRRFLTHHLLPEVAFEDDLPTEPAAESSQEVEAQAKPSPDASDSIPTGSDPDPGGTQ